MRWKPRTEYSLLVGWLLAVGCMPQTPVLPSVNATFKLVVADSHKTIREIVEDRPEYLELDDRERMALRFRTTFDERVRVGDRLGVEFEPRGFRVPVPEETAPGEKLPPARVSFGFGDSRIQVVSATVERGWLGLVVDNGLSMPVSVELVLPEFRREDGSTPALQVKKLLSAEVREVGIDLTETVFVPEDPLGIVLILSAETVAGDTAADIREEPSIGIEVASGSGLAFGRLEGWLNRVELPFRPRVKEVDFPRGLGHLDLGDAAITAYLKSATGFTSKLELGIDGINRFGESGGFFINQDFARGNPAEPVDIVLQTRSEKLVSFINLLPVEVVISPAVWVGEGKEIEVIEPDHWVQLDSVVFHAGPRFRIRADTRVENDPVHRHMDNPEVREHVQRKLAGVRLITTIESHVEIDIRVRLTVARRAEDLYVSPDLVIPQQGAFWVRPAATDGEGRVIETVASRTEVELDREEILMFLEEEGVYTGVLVQFGGTEDYLEMEGGDFFNVHAAAEITTDIGGVHP